MKSFAQFLNDHLNESIFAVRESPFEKKSRLRRGYTKIVSIDAAKFKHRWEEDHKDKLDWNPHRLERMRSLEGVDAYPQVFIDPFGKVDVLDGRHRISRAAELNCPLEVAVRKNVALPTEVLAR